MTAAQPAFSKQYVSDLGLKMENNGVDVLMITYNRPRYTRMALRELLQRSDPSTRVWVWHNGNHQATLELLEEYRPRLHRFHHSKVNVGLTRPTNWLFEGASGSYLSKVDDDCIVPERWLEKLTKAHEDEPAFGVIGCWRFPEEDFIPETAAQKIKTFSGGHQLLVNLWVEGSGYLMKRACVQKMGCLRETQSFTDYCIRLGRAGWINGWLYPFLYQEHMDDPRARHTGLRTDADLEKFLPLSARRNGITKIDDWIAQLKQSARTVQEAPIDPRYWTPTRQRIRRIRGRLGRWLSR